MLDLPRDELDECWRELNSGLSIKDGGMGISQKVSGHHLVIGVAQIALHRTLRSRPEITEEIEICDIELPDGATLKTLDKYWQNY